MVQKSETPHGGGASRNSCGGCFRDPLTPPEEQAQILVAAHHIRLELTATVVSVTFGRRRHG